MSWLSIPVCASQTWNRLFVNESRLFTFLVLFRLLNALLVQTAFVPDEFWQSIEVAHRWVFGFGSLTWEWRPAIALRSPFHPLAIAMLYRFGQLVGIDSTRFVLLAPRLGHALLAAIADFHLFRLSTRLAGLETAKWVLFHQLANWCTAFCCPRPLANCLEWALTTIALDNFPCWPIEVVKQHNKPNSAFSLSRTRRFIILAIGCVVLRPTAAVIWGPLCLVHLVCVYLTAHNHADRAKETTRHSRHVPGLQNVLFEYIIWGSIWSICSIMADRWAYGCWTINQWNFIQFNLLGGGSHTYGVHPWHWYLSQGVPVILLTQLPFVALGVWTDCCALSNRQVGSNQKECHLLTTLLVWTVFCYSLLGHKEFRFLLPIVPVAMYFCGRGTIHLLRRFHKSRGAFSCIVLFVICTQMPVFLYTSLVHQRGTLDALSFVNKAMERQYVHGPGQLIDFQKTGDTWSILSLMPCHTLPSVGFLHKNVTFRQLACDPDLSRWFGSTAPHYDEADHFYADPVAWLTAEFSSAHVERTRSGSNMPHFILLFDHLLHTTPRVKQLLLTQWGYHQCGRFFHAHLLTHRRYGHYVLAWCRSDVSV